MRGDLGASESRTRVETNAVSACAAVDLDLTGVGLEVLGGVFSSDTALDGVSALADRVLGETELGKARSGSDLDLGGDDVDTGDGFGDGVFDLDTGWRGRGSTQERQARNK